MFSSVYKPAIWLIVIWFAVLQSLSPLMHAHLESDSPNAGHGLHIHLTDNEIQRDTTHTAIDHVHSINDANTALHTIQMDKALVKNFALIPTVFLIFLFVCALNLALKLYVKTADLELKPYPLFLRPHASPRAPPSF